MTEISADQSNLPIVFDRFFQPNSDSRLYHYCSTATFLSILEYGCIRFSDTNMMNDAQEGRYGYGLFEDAATALLKIRSEKAALDGLDINFFDRVDSYLSPKQLISHPVIACFSKDPDVLSQWRGYASEARGWAVGFEAAALAKMPVTLLEVVYEPNRQLKEVRNYLAGMFATWREKGGEFNTAVGRDAALLSSLLLAYKHPSFREEQEVRALHELRVKIEPDGWQLVDEGGESDGGEVEGRPVAFRPAGESIVAYIDIPLPNVDEGVISDIWFGPRNDNGPGNAIYPLTRFGHRNVSLNRSTSSFRG